MKSPLSFSDQEGTPRRAQAPASAQRAEGAPGLVKLKSSDTPSVDEVQIDATQARMKRLRRSVTVAAALFGDCLGPRRFKAAMVTLTYRGVDDFSPQHISALLTRMRAWLKRRGYRLCYVWVAELQKRGALHYHVLVWLPRVLTLPKPDKQGWWPHGSTRIEWARNAVGYLCKYISKFDSAGTFPKGAKLHHSGGHNAFAKPIRRWHNLPSWLKCLAGVESHFVRTKGVGLVERSTGLCMPSPWRVSPRATVDSVAQRAHIGAPQEMIGVRSNFGVRTRRISFKPSMQSR